MNTIKGLLFIIASNYIVYRWYWVGEVFFWCGIIFVLIGFISTLE